MTSDTGKSEGCSLAPFSFILRIFALVVLPENVVRSSHVTGMRHHQGNKATRLEHNQKLGKVESYLETQRLAGTVGKCGQEFTAFLLTRLAPAIFMHKGNGISTTIKNAARISTRGKPTILSGVAHMPSTLQPSVPRTCLGLRRRSPPSPGCAPGISQASATKCRTTIGQKHDRWLTCRGVLRLQSRGHG